MSTETYYYGQGRLSLAVLDAITGLPGKYVWAGDVSAFNLKLASTQVKHQESFTGQRGLVRYFPVGAEMTADMTFHEFGSDNLAKLLRSTVVTATTGTVSAETLPDALAQGDQAFLANPGVSSVVITDSAGTPATLTAGTDYNVNANTGRIDIVGDLASYTQPLKAAYSYAANTKVGMFTTGQKNYALKYEGINLAEGNAPVIVDVYKLAPDILQQLDLVTSGSDVAGMQVTGGCLLDTTKPATGALGQFGSVTQLAAVA